MSANFLLQVLILLGAIVLVVPVLQKIGAGSVSGYLVAGLLIGPPLFGWVTEFELIGSIAEFGVVFLLFSIGIELRPARLWLMRRLVFGLGTAQLLLCGAVLATALHLGGFTPAAATICGLALALSSTAIVVQLLAERRELASQRGRASFAILLMQDVAVAPLITLVYLLGADGANAGDGALHAILKALAALAAVLIVGRFAWRHLLPTLATLRNADMLVAVALLLVLGAAWLMENAGTSLALGAFLAGVLLADSPFRHQVVADIQPFRGILLGLFFMSVGMSIDRDGVLANGPALLALALALMALKALLIALLLRAFGLGTRDAIKGGALLAQAGEFALILFALAASQSLIDADD
ncbi:MAG TPA: cation:proton antiporter, partial [Pseudomonadales bacterium]|nr:cation:proton antiporter [Pseudomonadales bacterium]